MIGRWLPCEITSARVRHFPSASDPSQNLIHWASSMNELKAILSFFCSPMQSHLCVRLSQHLSHLRWSGCSEGKGFPCNCFLRSNQKTSCYWTQTSWKHQIRTQAIVDGTSGHSDRNHRNKSCDD